MGFDINDHCDDPYLVDFTKRKEAHIASALDRANTALMNASQTAAVLSESPHAVAAQAQVDRIALAAQSVAIAERQGDKGLAGEFAKLAETEALILDSFDYAKVDGLERHVVHGI